VVESRRVRSGNDSLGEEDRLDEEDYDCIVMGAIGCLSNCSRCIQEERSDSLNGAALEMTRPDINLLTRLMERPRKRVLR
jgi:hypothetical protein